MKLTEQQKEQYHKILDSILIEFEKYSLDGIDNLILENTSVDLFENTTVVTINTEIVYSNDGQLEIESMDGTKFTCDLHNNMLEEIELTMPE